MESAEPPISDSPSTSAGEGGGDAAAGSAAPWAKELTTPGTKIGTVKSDAFQVDVYEVDTTEATKKSMLADAETNEPLIDVGDEIVWVNYVVTNIGDEPIDLGYSLLRISAKYPDWPYLRGTVSVTELDQREELGVNSGAFKVGSGDAPFTFSPGESYGVGENFVYQGAKELDLKMTAVPVDADGELLHDQTMEFESSIKLS